MVLPVLNAEINISSDFYLKCAQRFLLIFTLILIFEIIDLENDDPHLQTVPQQIGVKRTKILGFILLIVFCGLEFFNSNVNFQFGRMLLTFVIAIVIALFLLFANEKAPILHFFLGRKYSDPMEVDAIFGNKSLNLCWV